MEANSRAFFLFIACVALAPAAAAMPTVYVATGQHCEVIVGQGECAPLGGNGGSMSGGLVLGASADGSNYVCVGIDNSNRPVLVECDPTTLPDKLLDRVALPDAVDVRAFHILLS